MRKEYIASGKTLDEAIAKVCVLADATIDNLELEVLEVGKSGLFGIGRRDYKVQAFVDAPDPEPSQTQQPASTFGKKKSKRERFEEKQAKQAKTGQDIEIRTPVVLPADAPPEVLAAVASQAPAPRADRPERGERGDRPERGERKPRPERKRSPRPERAERGERPERGDRPERPERPERGDKPERGERGERPERPERSRRHDSHAVVISEGEMADRLYAEARAFLDPIFVKLDVQPELTPQVREGILWLLIRGEGLGILIGRRGETLNSLQYLVNLAVNKKRHEHARLVLDVAGYREGREETLTSLALKMAEKAIRSGRRVELEPMNPHERRVVHIALQGDSRVDTVSHGEEPYRRVVINPKNRKSNRKPRRPLAEAAEQLEDKVEVITDQLEDKVEALGDKIEDKAEQVVAAVKELVD